MNRNARFLHSSILINKIHYVSLKIYRCLANFECTNRPSAGPFLLRGAVFFKIGHLKRRLKQLHLEKDPGYNTR